MVSSSGFVIIGEGLSHVLGTDGRSWYDFWSGFGADLGQIAFVGAAIGLYRKHNCHVKGCWRIAKQPLEHDGTTWMVCHQAPPRRPADAGDDDSAGGREEVRPGQTPPQTSVRLSRSLLRMPILLPSHTSGS